MSGLSRWEKLLNNLLSKSSKPRYDGTKRVQKDTEVNESSSNQDQSGDTDELSTDQKFELLMNQRRRHVLQYLMEEGTATTGELAEHIAALENDKALDSISSKERKTVYVGLYQVHLPKLDDYNVVDFNENRGDVTLAERADQLGSYLATKSESGTGWWRYYFALSALGTVGYILFLLMDLNLNTLRIGTALLISTILFVAILHWRTKTT